MLEEITKKVNLATSIKAKPVKKLKEILALLDEDELRDWYFEITQKNTNVNKQKIIDKIFIELSKENVIHNFLYNLTEEEYLNILKILENNGELQDDYIDESFKYLREFGVIHTFNYENHVHVVMPNEIMEIFKNIELDKYKNRTKENSKIVSLAESMVNYYGAVPFYLFFDACEKFYGYSENDNVNLGAIFIPKRNYITAFKSEEDVYIIKEEIDEPFEKINILRIINNIEDHYNDYDFKELELEELLKYKDTFYFKKSDAVIKFEEYLKSLYPNKNLDTDLILSVLLYSFRREYNEGICTIGGMLEDENIEITEENIHEFMRHINEIISDIPTWGNKGWTNNEIILGKCYD